MTIRSRHRKRLQQIDAELKRIGWCKVTPTDTRNHDDKPQKDHAWLLENAKRNQQGK